MVGDLSPAVNLVHLYAERAEFVRSRQDIGVFAAAPEGVNVVVLQEEHGLGSRPFGDQPHQLSLEVQGLDIVGRAQPHRPNRPVPCRVVTVQPPVRHRGWYRDLSTQLSPLRTGERRRYRIHRAVCGQS